MKQKSKDQNKQQGMDDARSRQGATGQSGHESLQGHGGQDTGSRQSANQGQPRQSSGKPEDDLIGMDEPGEVQQSAQREGMGHHRHSGRGNEQNLDGTIDIDDLGTHSKGAGTSR